MSVTVCNPLKSHLTPHYGRLQAVPDTIGETPLAEAVVGFDGDGLVQVYGTCRGLVLHDAVEAVADALALGSAKLTVIIADGLGNPRGWYRASDLFAIVRGRVR